MSVHARSFLWIVRAKLILQGVGEISPRLTTETFPRYIELHSVNFIGIEYKRKNHKKYTVHLEYVLNLSLVAQGFEWQVDLMLVG